MDNCPTIILTPTLFSPGEIRCSTPAADFLSPAEIADILSRHLEGDWGEICDSDKITNYRALSRIRPAMILSIYTIRDTEVWVITEWDRSATTILFPSER